VLREGVTPPIFLWGDTSLGNNSHWLRRALKFSDCGAACTQARQYMQERSADRGMRLLWDCRLRRDDACKRAAGDEVCSPRTDSPSRGDFRHASAVKAGGEIGFASVLAGCGFWPFPPVPLCADDAAQERPRERFANTQSSNCKMPLVTTWTRTRSQPGRGAGKR